MSEQPWRDEDWMRERFEAGKTAAEIGEGVDCHVFTIYKWARIHGIQTRRWRDEDWLREEYQAGKTPTEIAEEAGCCYTTIRRWLRRHDIPEKLWKNKDKTRGGPVTGMGPSTGLAKELWDADPEDLGLSPLGNDEPGSSGTRGPKRSPDEAEKRGAEEARSAGRRDGCNEAKNREARRR